MSELPILPGTLLSPTSRACQYWPQLSLPPQYLYKQSLSPLSLSYLCLNLILDTQAAESYTFKRTMWKHHLSPLYILPYLPQPKGSPGPMAWSCTTAAGMQGCGGWGCRKGWADGTPLTSVTPHISTPEWLPWFHQHRDSVTPPWLGLW